MNKKELVARIAQSTGFSQAQIARALDSTIALIRDELVVKPKKTSRALDSTIQLIRDPIPGSGKKARALDSTIHLISEEQVTAGKVKIPGLGTFYTVARKARVGRNPRTGAEVRIKARIVPKFKPSQALVARINK